MNKTPIKNTFYTLIVFFKPKPKLNRTKLLKLKVDEPEPELSH